jgi:hypothetical protein
MNGMIKRVALSHRGEAFAAAGHQKTLVAPKTPFARAKAMGLE